MRERTHNWVKIVDLVDSLLLTYFLASTIFYSSVSNNPNYLNNYLINNYLVPTSRYYDVISEAFVTSSHTSRRIGNSKTVCIRRWKVEYTTSTLFVSNTNGIYLVFYVVKLKLEKKSIKSEKTKIPSLDPCQLRAARG